MKKNTPQGEDTGLFPVLKKEILTHLNWNNGNNTGVILAKINLFPQIIPLKLTKSFVRV